MDTVAISTSAFVKTAQICVENSTKRGRCVSLMISGARFCVGERRGGSKR